jgi:AcrR family transcriptional regulator
MEPSVAEVRARRRAVRREQSRAEILDAAERVFGEDGIREGSLRRIAAMSGFSSGAIYLFFENKKQLVFEALSRRGDEMSLAMASAASASANAMDKLHALTDISCNFFDDQPYFRNMYIQLGGAAVLAGPLESEPSEVRPACFTSITSTLAGVIAEGQASGLVRDGDARSLAHLYSVLVNEFVLSTVNSTVPALTNDQFHGLLDGAFRAPGAPRTPAR